MVGLSITATVGIVGLVGLLALSAFFSSSETAVFTLPDAWLADQDEATDPRVAVLRRLRADPHRLLVTILVGNNVVNVAIASVTTALLLTVLPPGPAVTVATILASVVVLVFGEIVPKAYGLGHARTWAPAVARPLAVTGTVLSPLVVVFDGVTRWLSERLGGEPTIEEPYVD